MGLGRLIFELTIAGLVVWRVSTTIAVAKIFEPLRDALDPERRVDSFSGRKRKLKAWLHELVCCQFCISHYVALLYLQFWHVDLVHTRSSLVDFGITWMAVVGLSSIIARVYQRAPARNSGRPAAVPPGESLLRYGLPGRRPAYQSSYSGESGHLSGVRKQAS
jgi:hypothetical protein